MVPFRSLHSSVQKPPPANAWNAIRFSLLLVALFFLSGSTLPAQSPYDTCAHRTGETATIIVPTDAELLLDGTHLSPGDQVAVFAPGGVCAGTLTVARKHAALTLWGDDVTTETPDGLRPGEPLVFHVWDASTGMEYTTENSSFSVSFRGDAAYLTRESHYVPNGIYVLNHLSVSSLDQTAVRDR